MFNIKPGILLCAALISLVPIVGFSATLGGPAIATDHPYHPGPGRYRTIQDCINEAYTMAGNPTTDRLKAEAIWKWYCTKMVHGANQPIEYINSSSSMTPYQSIGAQDTMKYLYSYGYGICFAQSTAMSGFWQAAGFPARGRGVSGHTVHEVYYDGDYHYYDADMGGTCFQSDHTTVASVNEIAANPSLFNWDYRTGGYDWPYFPWDGPATMIGAFTNPTLNHYPDNGTAVHPSNLNLRRGETFTQYFNPDRTPWGLSNTHWAGLNYSAFPNGPSRPEGFVYDPPVSGTNNGRATTPYVSDGNLRYGNGVFEWTPTLHNDNITDGAESIANVAWGTSSPKLRGSSGTGTVIISQWTPYVIAGNPDSYDFNSNPVDAIVITGTAVGSGVQVGISKDNGLTWDMRTVSGAFSQDFSSGMVGKYGYKVKLTLPNGAGLDALTIRTVTMCGPGMLPHLKDGSNTVTYSATQESVIYYAPNYSSETAWTNSFHSITNIAYAGGQTIHSASVLNNTQDAILVVKLDSPNGGDITKVAAAVGMQLGQPPTAAAVMKFHYSRNGSTWTEFHSRNVATETNHWSHYFSKDVVVPGTGSTVYIRVQYTPNSKWANFTQMCFYGYHKTGATPELEITHCWNDSGGTNKTHVETIAAGATTDTYSVTCATNVTSQYVKFACPAATSSFVDTDGDGMSDEWETLNSLDPDDAGDAGLDPDGDGAINLHEYLAGTDPNSGTSTPDPGTQSGGSGSPNSVTLDSTVITSDGEIDMEASGGLDDIAPWTNGRLRIEGHSNGTSTDRAFIKFDLTSITDCGTVDSATLQLPIRDVTSTALDSGFNHVQIGAASSDIATPTHSWNGMSSISAIAGTTDITNLGAAPADGTYEDTTATSAVTHWLEDGNANNGFILQVQNEAGAHEKRAWYSTSQGGAPALPKLVINYHTGGATVPNNAPVISAPASGATLNAIINTSIAFACTATDADSDPLTYEWDIDASDGITFTDGTGSSFNYAGYSTAGVYYAIVRVSDGFGGYDYATVEVTVTDMTDGILGIGNVNIIANRSNYDAVPNSTATVSLVGSGQVNTVTYNPSTLPAWATITGIPSLPTTSGFTMTISVDPIAASLTNGNYSFTVTLTDSTNGPVSFVVNLTVADYAGSADSDSDGIPDAWEIAIFGSITDCDPNDDFDGDGVTNLNEYITGGDPVDLKKSTSESECALTVVRQTNGLSTAVAAGLLIVGIIRRNRN